MSSQHIILPGITTTEGADWRTLVAEAAELGLTTAALFPTLLKPAERRELYEALEQTELQTLPHVHLRDDMERWEMEYLVERWQAEVFNLHPTEAGVALLERLPEYRDRIYLENGRTITPLHRDGLQRCAGVCLDFSHWEDFGYTRNNEGYGEFAAVVQAHGVGCCHISAVIREGWRHPVRSDEVRYNRHYFEELAEFDYLTRYREYFPSYLSIELENSLSEQLLVKAYLEETVLA